MTETNNNGTPKEDTHKSDWPVFDIPKRDMPFLVTCHLLVTAIFIIINTWKILQ